MTNTGLGDLSYCYFYGPGGSLTTIWTDDNKQYYSATISFNNRSTTQEKLSAPFPEQAPCDGFIKIKEVDASAKKLNVKLGVGGSLSDLDSNNIKFYNVPIY
jgi:hypothetical protein